MTNVQVLTINRRAFCEWDARSLNSLWILCAFTLSYLDLPQPGSQHHSWGVCTSTYNKSACINVSIMARWLIWM